MPAGQMGVPQSVWGEGTQGKSRFCRSHVSYRLNGECERAYEGGTRSFDRSSHASHLDNPLVHTSQVSDPARV